MEDKLSDIVTKIKVELCKHACGDRTCNTLKDTGKPSHLCYRAVSIKTISDTIDKIIEENINE